jgi:hypothetical protein
MAKNRSGEIFVVANYDPVSVMQIEIDHNFNTCFLDSPETTSDRLEKMFFPPLTTIKSQGHRLKRRPRKWHRRNTRTKNMTLLHNES